MLFALETKGSAFKPSINKPLITWRLQKFAEHHQGFRERTDSESTLVDEHLKRQLRLKLKSQLRHLLRHLKIAA